VIWPGRGAAAERAGIPPAIPARAPMNGAIHTAAPEQRVGGITNRLHPLLCNVPAMTGEAMETDSLVIGLFLTPKLSFLQLTFGAPCRSWAKVRVWIYPFSRRKFNSAIPPNR